MDQSAASPTPALLHESIPEPLPVESETNAPISRPKISPSYGVHGVRLKHFEQILVKVLPRVQPNYVCLPPLPPPRSSSLSSSSFSSPLHQEYPSHEWPFDRLPKSARVWGDLPGQLSQQSRAERKEQQLRSMLRCILPFIPQDGHVPLSEDDDANRDKEPFTLVDFGGGSGHLGIPLALLFPHCRVVVVDLAKRSLDLMHQKAAMVIQEIQQQQQNNNTLSDYQSKVPIPSWMDDPAFYCCGQDGILANLFSFHGPVERYNQALDIALALHLCGQATDVALHKAGLAKATAMIVAPCCVGKLSRQVQNPDIYHATGQNSPTVSYPQSSLFCQLLSQADPHNTTTTTTPSFSTASKDDWDALAKAADYSNEQEARTSRNATRRTAKAVLETDRRLCLEERFHYKTALMRMDPWEATPKNDILVAWNPDQVAVAFDDTNDHLFSIPDTNAMADLEVVTRQLLPPLDPGVTPTLHATASTSSVVCNSSSDWTPAEEEEIAQQIQAFLDQTAHMTDKMDQVYLFPTRMGGRKRKLIHFVAQRLDLAHWSVGEKDSQKTVAVARRGQRKRKPNEGPTNSTPIMN